MTLRVVILGGGFSGAIAALHLARRHDAPLAIDVIEPRPLLGGGVAYSAPDPSHRINVPAARMSAYSDDMGHFDRWARQRGLVQTDPDSLYRGEHLFTARIAFGRYLDEQVRRQAAAGPAVLRHLRQRAVSAAPLAGGYAVVLEDGTMLAADILIIATSHPPPSVPAPLAKALAGSARLIADSWQEGGLEALRPDDRVLIMGTGLTMADIIASLQAAGHRGPITAFSRRGLIPRGHAWDGAEPIGDFGRDPAPTALALLRHIRREVRGAVAAGRTWHAVLDAVRRDGRTVWRALPLDEQRRLLRHLRPFWDVHRYRIAPQPEAVLRRWLDAGQLTIHAASLAGIAEAPDGLVASLRLRRTGAIVEQPADALILATGPSHDALLQRSPPLATLAEAGCLRADPLGLGIAVDEHSRAIGRDGQADGTLWVAGPLARATFGELMGLPQVLTHAEDVAIAVAGALRSSGVPPALDRDHPPDRLDHPERPGALQKSIG